MLVSGMFPALRLFGDPRCPIVSMVRLFLNVAALLIMNVLIAPYDCIRNPCIMLGGESSEPSAHAQKSLCRLQLYSTTSMDGTSYAYCTV